MPYTLELLVKLKVPDVTALTAKHALQRRLGYADVLVDLRRADYYRFVTEAADEAAATKLVREAAERTTLFVNPNKHSYEVRFRDDDWRVTIAGPGLYSVEVLVTELNGGGAALREALQAQWPGAQAIQELSAGILWTLILKAESAAQARQIAEEIAVTRRVNKGLLINPHYQECQIAA